MLEGLDELREIIGRWRIGKVSREEVLQAGFSLCREKTRMREGVFDYILRHSPSELHSVVDDIQLLLSKPSVEDEPK